MIRRKQKKKNNEELKVSQNDCFLTSIHKVVEALREGTPRSQNDC